MAENLAGDAELLERYRRSGDEVAFEELARRHSPMVYRACLRLVGDAHRAEDAAQAVFVILARRASSFRAGGELAAWLHGMARRVAAETRRGERRRVRREEEATAMVGIAGSGGGASGEGRAAALEALDREVARLPAIERQAVVLRYLEGRSLSEAAAVARCPEGTLGRRAHDGLERLRTRLCQRGRVLGSAALVGLLGAEATAAVPATLLPSILAVPKLAAAGAAAGMAGSTAVSLAEGVLKAMFWIKVKIAAAVLVGAAAVGGGGAAVVMAAAEPAVPKVYPPGRAEGRTPIAESGKPAPAEAGKVAWGDAVAGLQAGIVPLGGVAAKDWPEPFLCVKCREFNRMLVTSKCGDCGVECHSNRKLQLCASCAARKRVCQACGAAKPSGATFTEGEPLAFEVHAKNVGDAELQLLDAGHAPNWGLEFKRAADGRVYRPVPMSDDMRAGPANLALDKGRTATLTRTVAAPEWKFRADGAAGLVDALPAGKYAVTAGYGHAEHRAGGKPCAFWHGQVTTGAVGIEVRPKAAAAADWQKLFADEAWYKGQAGEEQVFAGALEGVPAGGPSTLQRTSYYKLGGRTLYTGARKLPALDALVGRKVEVRGKPVDMALEGREIQEIWPAAVRAAP